MRIGTLLEISCLLLFGALPAYAADDPRYRVETIAEGLEFPWSVAFLPDGRALVTERVGHLRVIADGKLLDPRIEGVPKPYVEGQAGLFDVVLDPEFASNGQIYLSFAQGRGRANRTRVVSAHLDGMQLTEVKPIFTATPTKATPVHFGGRMAFIADGTLVIGLGDGFDYREKAQRLDSHLGKIVRINKDGSVPVDNPFVGKSDALPEIYSYGHRNVQGMLYDAVDHILYMHEHGPRGGDELNIIEPGKNYGWPVATFGLDYSGAVISPFTERPGMVSPVHQWTPSIAPSDIAQYRGTLFADWDGDLIVTALAARCAQRLRVRDGKLVEGEVLFAELGERLRDVAVAPDGALWLLTDDKKGKVLRVVPR
jgi:glucose/arabinose dehydrogenase